MPVALPRNPFPAGTTPHKAYDICLGFERRASNLRQLLPQSVCARILGYMLIQLSLKIVDCANDDALGKLGQFYDIHFIHLCEYLLRL
jgi:hypothetical protein